uniref:Pectinesterase n=1 Tax=Ananas comosus var. bracteatus TaxID=296719 RepID=A0A6V7NTW6_ANACO|nr:unnamed protein product [Ananas comosus var. bracteatus]
MDQTGGPQTSLVLNLVDKANLVVAKEGSGDYTTISAAVAASAKLRSGTSRYVMHVKAGIYNENVQITESTKNLMLIGDGIGATIVTSSRNTKDGSTTFRGCWRWLHWSGHDVSEHGRATEESGGCPSVGSDLSVFYRCSFEGYQDTLYVHSQRQFYRNYDIYGTVDFIFGDAAIVFQSCNIFVRKPLANQKNTVTAQGRSDPNENTGISIYGSVITAASDLKPVQGAFKTYLGRPWRKYSRTVVMKTSLDSVINPAEWLTSLIWHVYCANDLGAETLR